MTNLLRWQPDQLQQLIDLLKTRGYRVQGPKVQDQAMIYGEIDSLPVGYGDAQDAGSYRLTQRDDQTRFGFNLGPSTWKQYLFPSEECVFSYRNGELVCNDEPAKPMAFFGVRACELAAIAIQDKVFDGDFAEHRYRARRQALFTVAVNCSQAAATCFCESTGDGPAVDQGADLVITEIGTSSPYYLVEAHSPEARALVDQIDGEPVSSDDIQRASEAVDRARNQMSRELREEDLGDALLDKLEHPHWNDVGERCLACGNCTQVCPTCFCSTSQERTNPVTLDVDHVRKWDSCFTANHSYVHGGVVHDSVKSRYRQWLTHKLGSWPEQFGVSGCTGCGRCIAWCPVAIDITEELKQLR